MTIKDTKPSILVIDDQADDLRDGVIAGLADCAASDVVHPNDVAIEHLKKADLVLIDHRLEYWRERDSQECLGLKPLKGLALAAILREHVDKSKKDRLTGFALHSGHLDDVRDRLPLGTAIHTLARLNNLEWVFPKDEPRRYDQMVILAEAVSQLPREWPVAEDKSAAKLKSLLGLNEEPLWSDRCWREVQECQPPIHDLRAGGHGVLLIRWLLHQVMPYPTFLWGDHWAAARLRVPVNDFRTILGDEKNPLSQEMKPMRYSGVLAGFLGNRWWRGALEDYVWELAGGGAGDAAVLHAALQDRAGKDLGFIEPNPPIVCLDQNFEPTDDFKAPENALRLRPDHWPAFADAAWMDIELVRSNPALAAMADPLDQDRIGGEGEE